MLPDAAGTIWPVGVWGIRNAEAGKVYTIRAIPETDDSYGFLLEEIDNSHVKNVNGREPSFSPARFRPLITKSQQEDIRMIKSLVREMPATERLDRLAELLDE